MNDILNLTVQDLASKLENGEALCFIDVRQKWEYEICSLPNSLHIPLLELAERLDEIPQRQEIVVLCHHGVRSFQAAKILLENDFCNVFNLKGGIDAWSKQIDSSIASY